MPTSSMQRNFFETRSWQRSIALLGALPLLLLMLIAWPTEVSAAVAFRAASSAGVRTPTISYRGTGTVASAASGNITPTLSSVELNALLICVVEQRDNVAISFPAGWNQLYSTSGTATHRASVFYKRSASAESNPLITHGGGNAIIAQCSTLRGVDTTNPLDVAYAAQYAANSTNVASGSLTTLTANDWILYAMHVADNASVTATPSGPGGIVWNQRFYNSTASALRAAIGLYTGTATTAGTTVGPISASISPSAENQGALLALRSGSSLSIAVPTGTVLNDVMIASIATTSSSVAITAPAGWTAVQSVTQPSGGNGGSRLVTYYRVATASEPASYSWTLSTNHTGAAGGIASFSGVNTTNPIDASAASATVSALTHTAPSVTTTVANDMLVTVHQFGSSSTWTPPAGMSEAVDQASRAPNNGGVTVEMNYLLLGAAGATGTRTATAAGNADNGATVTVALKALPGIDHIEIDYPQATLSSCAPTTVTVFACATAGTTCTSLYTGGISVTLAPGGNVVNIPAGSGSATGTVSQGAGAGTLNAASVAPNVATCKNTATGAFACGVTFSNTVLSVTVPNFKSGTNVSASVAGCGITNGANTVNFYTSYSDPATGTKQVSIAPQTGAGPTCGTFQTISTSSGAQTGVSLTFASNAASFCLSYPDVGKINLSASTGASNTSRQFVAVPDRFILSNINCVSGCSATPNPGAANASGAAFMKAGNPFSLTVSAYNGAATPALTPNFGKEAVAETVTLTPAASMPDLPGAVVGNLTCNTASATCSNVVGGLAVIGAFSGGAASNSFVYDEVGIMTLTPSLYDPDGKGYLSVGNAILNASGTVSGTIGRFIPDHFTVDADPINPILAQADWTQTSTTASATTAPATVINVASTAGFQIGGKLRIPGAGAAGAAFTTTITAVDSIGLTLTVNTTIGTSLIGGESVISEWGSYMGEPFNAQFTLTAVDVSGANVTQNYQGAYAKLNLSTGMGFGAVSGATNLTSRLGVGTVTGAFSSGSATVSAALNISRGPSPGAPFTAVKIGIAPIDTDTVRMSPYDLNVGGSLDRSTIMDPLVQATTEVRYGRLRMQNALGSELLTLPTPLTVEYYNGTNWLRAVEDNSTTLNLAGSGTCTGSPATSCTWGALTIATTRNLAASATTPALLDGNSFLVNSQPVNGNFGLRLTAPGSGKTGGLKITAAVPSYLQHTWNSSSNTDPSAFVTFGINKSHFIFMRENY